MSKSQPIIIRVKASDLKAAKIDLLEFIQNPLDAIMTTAHTVGADKGYGAEGIVDALGEIIDDLGLAGRGEVDLYSIGGDTEFKVMIDGVEQDAVDAERRALRSEIQQLQARIERAEKRLLELV